MEATDACDDRATLDADVAEEAMEEATEEACDEADDDCAEETLAAEDELTEEIAEEEDDEEASCCRSAKTSSADRLSDVRPCVSVIQYPRFDTVGLCDVMELT